MVDWTASEQFEEIRDCVTNSVVLLQGSLHEKEKSLDEVALSLDCSEIVVNPWRSDSRSKFGKCSKPQCFWEAVEFNDPELANREGSGHNFSSTLYRNHVSEAK